MRRKKRIKILVSILSILLIFTTGFSNVAAAGSKEQKATSFASKKEKSLKVANSQKKTEKQQKSAAKDNKKASVSKQETKARKSELSKQASKATSQSTKKVTPTKENEKKANSASIISEKSIQNKKNSKEYSSDELIIKFKNNTSSASASTVRNKHSLKTEKKLKSIGAEVVKVKKGSNIDSLVKTLKANPSVEYVQPNYKYLPADIPNDPEFIKLWGLHNTGQEVNWVTGVDDMDIDYPETMDFVINSTSPNQVIVGVIDSGIDINHPDLTANIWTNTAEVPNNGIDDDNNGYIDDVNGWDFYNGDNTVFDVEDGDEHGTHVAGTIAASKNNGIGITGIAPNVKIMPLKFLGPEGGWTSDAVQAIEYSVKMGAKISNNSWTSSQYDPALKDAIDKANMLFVTAAGNDSFDIDSEPEYPASFDSENILSVAAINSTGNLAEFSNYGFQNVDIAAPGTNIYSTVPKKLEKGIAAEINNSTESYKAVFNGIGFENFDPSIQQDAFNKALEYAGVFNTTYPRILLVQDDGSDTEHTNYYEFYRGLLAGAGLTGGTSYTVMTDENGPALEDIISEGFDTIIWFTGDTIGNEQPNLTPTDINTLDQFLKTGNKSVILSGQDILYRNENTSFVKDTLAIDILGEGVTREYAQGVVGTIYEGTEYPLNFVPFADYISSNDNSISKVNLILPGTTYENAYEYDNGTSMAAPHVSGVASLVAGLHPNLEIDKIKNIVINTGDSLDSLNNKINSGKTLNAFNAVSYDPNNLDNDVPGISYEGESVDGSLDVASDLDDVYSIYLNAGETIKATLTGEVGTDFDLYLYSPYTTSVNNAGDMDYGNYMLAYSENEETSNETFEYVAEESGTYFIDIYAFAGAGSYELSAVAGNGAGTYENTSSSINYFGSWNDIHSTIHSNGTASQLSNNFGGLFFTFIGNEIEWFGFKDKTQGIAEVYIDGVLMGNVSLYSDVLTAQQSLFKKTLAYGKHDISIYWTGQRDIRARKSGTSINVDKLVVSENLTPPATPTGVNVVYGVNSPEIRWNISEQSQGYNVYRKESGSDTYSMLNSNPITGIYYPDYTAVPGKIYEYAVSAVTTFGTKKIESVKSAPVTYIYDDQIPGVPTTSTSITGNIDAINDYTDIWAVTLEAGKTYNFSFNGPEGTDFDYKLYDSTATDIYESTPVRELWGDTSEEYVTYPVETTGTYYIRASAYEGSGDYSININNKPTVKDDDIPFAVPLTGTDATVSDFLDPYDFDDVYSVELAKGDTLTLNLSSTATNGSDFDLYLYGPNATTVDYHAPNYIPEITISNKMDTSNETITYVAQEAGKYYIDIFGSFGSGPYTIDVHVKKITTSEPIVTKIDDTDSNIIFKGSWSTTNSSAFYNNSLKYSMVSGDTIEYSFVGTGIRWIATVKPMYGIADVYIDGQLATQVSLYSPSNLHQQVVFEDLSLNKGQHSIKIVVKGTKVSSSSGKTISFDAFEIIDIPTPKLNLIDDSDSGIIYGGNWLTTTSSIYYNKTLKYTSVKGNSFEYSFTGTGISWIATKKSMYGIADVYLDDILVTQVDLYSSIIAHQQTVFKKDNLFNGQHKIKVIVKGEKNTLSTGNTISFDAFEITN